MRLNPSQLPGHLQSGLAPVYIVAGEEPLIVEEALDAIRAKARAQGFVEREVLETERGFEWGRLVESCASLSLFAQRRIVEVRLAGAPGDEGAAALQSLAARPDPDLLLIVATGRLDSRGRQAKWYLALENAGASLYAWPVRPEEFPRWLQGRLAAAGLQAAPDALRLLAERTEGNLLAAAQEIALLKLLHPQGALTVEDVRDAVADSARFVAFDLADKVLQGDAVGAARSLARLREEGEDVVPIVGALAFVFRQWARAAESFARTGDGAGACDAAGVMRSRQAHFIKGLQRQPTSGVRRTLARLCAIDWAAKSGQGRLAWEELLTSIVTASSAANASALTRT